MEDALGSLRDSLERSLEYLQRGFDLVMAYSELVDDVGHRYGPDSLEMKYTIGDVGKLLTTMFRQLDSRGLRGKVCQAAGLSFLVDALPEALPALHSQPVFAGERDPDRRPRHSDRRPR